MISGVNSATTNVYYAKNKNTKTSFDQEKIDTVDKTESVSSSKANVDVQDLFNYEAVGKMKVPEVKDVSTEETEKADEEKKPHKTSYYQGVPLEQWALTDPKYTDEGTGISWYVRDGKHPYMLGEDAEKFEKYCKENGEFALKKFAELTGLIQQVDENTVAYVGDNGIGIKSKDGKELFVDTSSMSYESIINMFKNLPSTDDYFNQNYWNKNIIEFSDK